MGAAGGTLGLIQGETGHGPTYLTSREHKYSVLLFGRLCSLLRYKIRRSGSVSSLTSSELDVKFDSKWIYFIESMLL